MKIYNVVIDQSQEKQVSEEFALICNLPAKYTKYRN